jgi:excisionase family DNA binding protein
MPLGTHSVLRGMISKRATNNFKAAIQSSDDDPEIMNKKQLAAMFSVSKRTIDDWVADRLLPYYRVGRRVFFNRSMILEHLDRECLVCCVCGSCRARR